MQEFLKKIKVMVSKVCKEINYKDSQNWFD